MNFEKIVEEIAALGLNVYDFAMWENGAIREHVFQTCNRCNDSYSVTKAYLMTAAGLLWDDGLLDVDAPISRYIALPDGMDPKWKRVTVDHVLTHRIGFSEGFLDIDVEDAAEYGAEDWLELILRHPIAEEPGARRQYSDAAYYLVSRLVSAIGGENADALLWRRVLRHMGLRELAWSRCPLGYPVGATGLYISSRDMVKLGALYLNGGEWDGKRLISREWVELALSRRYELAPFGEGDLVGKGGMYGQMLAFSPGGRFAYAFHMVDHDGGAAKINAVMDRAALN